jgi:hypothetical protein
MSGALQPDSADLASVGPPVDTSVDREAHSPVRRYFLHLGLPMSVSLLLHALLVVLLAFKLFIAPTPTGTPVGEWHGEVVPADDVNRPFDWTDVRPLDFPPPAEPSGASESPAATGGSELLDLSKLPPPTVVAAPAPGDGFGEGALSLLGTGSGAGAPGTGGFGEGQLSEGAGLGQAGIWNLSVRADKVVYVVDFSGSIIVAVDDLKRELKRSIGRLKPTQSFAVILFYSAGGGPDEQLKTESFRPQLEPAEPTVRREFFRWLERKAPMGVTEPLPAVRRALELEPDVIFLFSDGFFDDSVVTDITRANGSKRTRIYCLVFDDQLLGDASALTPRETEGSRRLKRIAEANGGRVKIVTAKDLAR